MLKLSSLGLGFSNKGLGVSASLGFYHSPPLTLNHRSGEKQFVLFSRESVSMFSVTKSLFLTKSLRNIAQGLVWKFNSILKKLNIVQFSKHVSRSLSKALLSNRVV